MPWRTTNPVVVYDDPGRVVDANEAAAELTGIPLGRLRGMHMRDFYHPDDLPELAERMRTARPGDELRFERWLRCCNGRYTRVQVRATRRLIGGWRAEYVPLSNEKMEYPGRLPVDEDQDLTRR